MPCKGKHNGQQNDANSPSNAGSVKQTDRIEHEEYTEQQPRAINGIRPIDVGEALDVEQFDKINRLPPYRAQNK